MNLKQKIGTLVGALSVVLFALITTAVASDRAYVEHDGKDYVDTNGVSGAFTPPAGCPKPELDGKFTPQDVVILYQGCAARFPESPCLVYAVRAQNEDGSTGTRVLCGSPARD